MEMDRAKKLKHRCSPVLGLRQCLFIFGVVNVLIFGHFQGFIKELFDWILDELDFCLHHIDWELLCVIAGSQFDVFGPVV